MGFYVFVQWLIVKYPVDRWMYKKKTPQITCIQTETKNTNTLKQFHSWDLLATSEHNIINVFGAQA